MVSQRLCYLNIMLSLAEIKTVSTQLIEYTIQACREAIETQTDLALEQCTTKLHLAPAPWCVNGAIRDVHVELTHTVAKYHTACVESNDLTTEKATLSKRINTIYVILEDLVSFSGEVIHMNKRMFDLSHRVHIKHVEPQGVPEVKNNDVKNVEKEVKKDVKKVTKEAVKKDVKKDVKKVTKEAVKKEVAKKNDERKVTGATEKAVTWKDTNTIVTKKNDERKVTGKDIEKNTKKDTKKKNRKRKQAAGDGDEKAKRRK